MPERTILSLVHNQQDNLSYVINQIVMSMAITNPTLGDEIIAGWRNVQAAPPPTYGLRV
jgi:hypothetical protein